MTIDPVAVAAMGEPNWRVPPDEVAAYLHPELLARAIASVQAAHDRPGTWLGGRRARCRTPRGEAPCGAAHCFLPVQDVVAPP